MTTDPMTNDPMTNDPMTNDPMTNDANDANDAMTNGSVFGHAGRVQRISGPGELIQAVPYLLGFHPRRSLVLIGLSAGRLVVTARLDLVDSAKSEVLAETLRAIVHGGATGVVAAIYGDDDDRGCPSGKDLPWSTLVDLLAERAVIVGCELIDALFVSRGRWWTYTCADDECCPVEGRAVPESPSAFAAAATYAGVVALPDREALADLLAPAPHADREQVGVLVGEAENEVVAAVLSAQGIRRSRSVKRAIFAAARTATGREWAEPNDADVARFGVALGEIATRDAVWMAIDSGRLDGRPLWRALARRLPSPYDAPALFLFGWATWRAGDGALAGISAERAVASDPSYSAADLLLAALSRGVDPRRLPRLRMPRSA